MEVSNTSFLCYFLLFYLISESHFPSWGETCKKFMERSAITDSGIYTDLPQNTLGYLRFSGHSLK